MMTEKHKSKLPAVGLTLLWLLTSLGMPLSAQAQQQKSSDSLYRPAHSLHGKTVIIPIGIHFEGRLDHTIGSSVSKQGERFEIEVSSPILANGTDVLIPAGAVVIGEVVECIPSGRLPHQKGFPKPTGKLRVQLSGLRTPDGITYPMVASLAGETISRGGGGRRGGGQERANTKLGHGVAYVGSSSSFEAVAPGAAQRLRTRPGQAPKVVTAREMMQDAIYGSGQDSTNQQGAGHIRSLVKKGTNLYILAGSPVSVKIDAPFKLGVAAAQGTSAALEAPADDEERRENNGGRRFAKRGTRQSQQEEQQDQQQVQQGGSIIPDVSQQGSGGFIPGGNSMFQTGGQGQGQGGNPGTIPSDGKPPGTDF